MTDKIWNRADMVTPDHIGTTVTVHNGHQNVSVRVTEDMVGNKFGEFALTRTPGNLPTRQSAR